MTRRLPVIVEAENLARVLWPEPFHAVNEARDNAIDGGFDPDLAVKHLRAATQSAIREGQQLLLRLDVAGLEIRHKRIRP